MILIKVKSSLKIHSLITNCKNSLSYVPLITRSIFILFATVWSNMFCSVPFAYFQRDPFSVMLPDLLGFEPQLKQEILNLHRFTIKFTSKVWNPCTPTVSRFNIYLYYLFECLKPVVTWISLHLNNTASAWLACMAIYDSIWQRWTAAGCFSVAGGHCELIFKITPLDVDGFDVKSLK